MRRLIPAAAAAMVFLFAPAARAHEGYKFELTAGLKKVPKGRDEFAMVFVEGHAHYPDGTSLRIGIRHPNMETYLKSVRVRVAKTQFMAEIGPWAQHFPPGKYPVIVEFNLEDQSEDVKQSLAEHDDFRNCLKDNPLYQDQFKKQNPEKYEAFMKVLRANGNRCLGENQSGGCILEVGSPEEAEQDRITEAALLEDTAEAGRELFAQLMRVRAPEPGSGSFEASDPRNWYNPWRDGWSGVEEPLRARRASLVWVNCERAYECLNSALLNMLFLQDVVHSQAFGEAAGWAAELGELQARGADVTRDERRRRDHLAGEIRKLTELRQGYERTIAESLAAARFGREGLEPSETGRRKYLGEMKDELGLEWELR